MMSCQTLIYITKLQWKSHECLSGFGSLRRRQQGPVRELLVGTQFPPFPRFFCHLRLGWSADRFGGLRRRCERRRRAVNGAARLRPTVGAVRRGTGTVALSVPLGGPLFDAGRIDPASVRLEGVAPTKWSREDVGTPFMPFLGKDDCHDLDRPLAPASARPVHIVAVDIAPRDAEASAAGNADRGRRAPTRRPTGLG